MTPSEAVERLEAVLVAENAALARLDADGATALLSEKLQAAEALPASGVSLKQAERLRTLAAENRLLLERAIRVQGRIVAMVARAARRATPALRYGARGGAVAERGGLAMRRQV